MKTSKKLICFLCCLVIIFTCATISWQPEAEAAAPIAAYVSSVVGSFILSAGFSFSSVGDFQTATDAFLESEVARGITEITTHIGNICALGNMSEPLLIHELINAGFFKDFWNSIYEFFGNGEITIETGESIPQPKDGFAYYNGVELPIIPTSCTYSNIYILHFIPDLEPDNDFYCILNTDAELKVYNSSGVLKTYSRNGAGKAYNFVPEKSSWILTKSQESGTLPYTGYKLSNLYPIWSNVDIYYSNNIYFAASEPPIFEGKENFEVIPVTNSSSHTADDIISSWARAAENGTAIDWQLDSIPASSVITSTNTADPLTLTQTDVLTQSGVKVQTQEEVKEEVKQEAIQELKNYTVTGLASIFPFCIPFDIYNFFSVLTAEREAPVFDFPLNFGKLGSHNVHVDLSGWDTVAQILRTIELLAFCVALAWGTSKLIKW